MAVLARWQSHKVVRAGRLLRQQFEDDEGETILTIEDMNGAPCVIRVPKDFFSRGAPMPGDFIIIYDDGYTRIC